MDALRFKALSWWDNKSIFVEGTVVVDVVVVTVVEVVVVSCVVVCGLLGAGVAERSNSQGGIACDVVDGVNLGSHL